VFALGHPGKGPAAISSELAREKHGGFCVSANGVYRVLRRHGLQTKGHTVSGRPNGLAPEMSTV